MIEMFGIVAPPLRPHGWIPADDTPLTRRQMEILVLMARGFRAADIAEELHLANESVKWHVRRTLAALGARTQAQAVAFGFQKGLLR